MASLSVCLCLGQVKKLVSKPMVRDACFYRKLTDGPKDDPPTSVTADSQLDSLLGERLEYVTAMYKSIHFLM